MHLDKNLILKELRSISLPVEKYWVVMGAALVLHGVKETTQDIDIGCNLELFTDLLARGYELKLSHSGKKKISIKENVNIYYEWEIKGYVIIDSIQVEDLDGIINDKRKLGRDKDMDDIIKIMMFMNKGKNKYD